MKKSIIIAFVLMGIIAQAQVRNYPPSGSKSKTTTPSSYSNSSNTSSTAKVKKVKAQRGKSYNDDSETKFGFVFGYQFSTEIGDEIIATNPRNGFYYGISLKNSFSDKIGLKTDLLYSNMGAKFGSSTDELNYIQLPVTVDFKFLKIAHFNVGPQIGYLLNAHFNNNDNYFSTLNRWDYGIVGGLNIQIPKTGFVIGGKYYYGLANIVENNSIKISNTAYSANLNYYF
jgi:hypothetical protein